MAEHDTVEFQCRCGKVLRARTTEGGKATTCPECAVKISIPRVALAPIDIPASESSAALRPRTSDFPSLKRLFKIPATFQELTLWLVISWAALGLFAFVLSMISTFWAVAGTLLFLAATASTGHQLWILLYARQRALVNKEVSLLWGLVRLVAWDPVEGVLFLQNKTLGFFDDDLHDGHGGIRFIYPVFGEELALRVPLELQTLRFDDDRVMTREYLSLRVCGTMKWRITDIRKFYLLVSRELRSTTDQGDRVSTSRSTKASATGDADAETTIKSLVNAAIEWLRVLTEEQTRTVISHVQSGLLIADRLAHEMPEFRTVNAAPGAPGKSEFGGAADGLASTIQTTLARRLMSYGIGVEDVSLQEVKLPDEIVEQCAIACKAAYLPLIAARQAAGRKAQLQAEVDVLGRDIVGTREVVSNAPPVALTDFLTQFLQKQLSSNNPGLALGAVTGLTATALGAVVPAQATAVN